MFCPDCGTEVGEGRRFCGKCGAALHASGSAGGVSVAVEAPPRALQPVAAQAPAPAARKRSPLTYVVAGLVLALAATAWWWFHRPAPPYEVKDPGIYPFQGLSADGKTMKWGFIDADGKVVVQPEWDNVDSSLLMGQSVFCNEGFCGVQKDGKWGFVDTAGHSAITAQFDSLGPFVEGLARVKLGNLVGYIDKTGRYVINPQFDGAGDFHGGLAAVHGNGGWGFINKAGVYAIKPRFQAADSSGFSEGLIGVCSGTESFLGMIPGKCGYVNRAGTFAVKPEFDAVDPFSEGLASVRINNKWGYINSAGAIVINPQFDSSSMFSAGLAVVGVSGHVGTINKTGKYVLNPGQYTIQGGEGKILPATTAAGMGLIGRDGTWVVKPTTALTQVEAIVGKVFYGKIGGLDRIPMSTSGKVLAGPYKGAMLDGLAQDIQNESDAIQVMHAVVNAETGYSAAYPAKGFASSLDKLEPGPGSMPDENHAGLIDFDIPSGVKSNYQFSITIPEGTSTGGTNFNYQLTGKPVSGHVGRTFCADSSGAVRYAMPEETCTTTSPTL